MSVVEALPALSVQDFSFSTSWNSQKHPDGKSVVEEILALGFNKLELDFRLTRVQFDEVKALHHSDDFEVPSLHNFSPIPDGIPVDKPNPDYFSLAALDENERRLAVHWTKKTLEEAAALQAKVVVLHLGKVRMQTRMRELLAFYREGKKDSREFRKLREEEIKDRASKAGQHIDPLFLSLNELVEYAQPRGIKLGCETRYYYHEIPIPTEFEMIFDAFPEEAMGYWHDTGHATAIEKLGFCEEDYFLKLFSKRLIGMHIHDINETLLDHVAPFRGQYDFRKIAPFRGPEFTKVLELRKTVHEGEIRDGVQRLTQILG